MRLARINKNVFVTFYVFENFVISIFRTARTKLRTHAGPPHRN